MLIKNNTSKKLVLYWGNPYREEPTKTVTLLQGENIDLGACPNEDISIQEK